ncbi:MAG: addiction module protein [Nitrospirales bacterium]|nr:addiction module protein [Nitrospirales bacterium]
MSTKELLEEALKLKPEDRFALVEGLIRSLDEPDKNIDAIWAEEAERRLKAYREGKIKGIPKGQEGQVLFLAVFLCSGYRRMTTGSLLYH